MSDLRLSAPNSISAGAPPQTPAGGAYSAPKPLAVFKGPTSKVMEGKRGKRREGKGKGRGGKGTRKRWEGRVVPQLGSLDPPVSACTRPAFVCSSEHGVFSMI